MATDSKMRALEALGKLDDVAIELRRHVEVNTLQAQLLEAQLATVEALVARGMTARQALEIVVAACAHAITDLEA